MLRHHTSLFGLSLTVFLLAMALSSCASRHTAAILNDVDTYIQQRPDSALATIRAIDTTTLTSRSLRAHYALLHAMALDKNWIDTTDVGVVMPAVEYYDQHPTDVRRAKSWYCLGRIQQNASDWTSAGISLLRAEKFAEASDDVAFRGMINQAISSVYSQLHLYEEALNYAEQAYRLFDEAKDTLSIYSSLLARAQNLYHLGRYIESDSLFCRLIDNNYVHPHLHADLLCDYALSCVSQNKDFGVAVHLFEQAVTNSGFLKDLNCLGAYAFALAHEGDIRRAEQLFEHIDNNNGRYSSYVYAFWKSKVEAFTGNYSSAYRLQVAASDIQNEIVKKSLKQSTIKAQKDFLEELNRESEKTARKRKIVTAGTISLLLILFILLTFFINQLSKQSAKEKESLIKAYSDLASQTEEEKAKIRSQYIRMCQSHLSHIGRINEMLYYHSTDADNSLYQELRSSMQTLGSNEQNQREFEIMLNEAFDDVMIHFREDFPNKKPRYYQLVGFLFAGFNTTTICTIIPTYNKHNVHVEKSRLKQMIQDSDSSYKELFLRLIL